MKKFLSIVLCLSMLMSLVPMSVFAAPVKVPEAQTADETVFADKDANGNLLDGEGFNVTYHPGTGASVGNMPSGDTAKGVYTVSSQVPTRKGYFFAGWTLQPGADETVTQVTVTSDTYLFAKWVVAAVVFDFASEDETKMSYSGYSADYDYENSTVSIEALNGDPRVYYTLKSDERFLGGDFPLVRVRMKAGQTSNAGHRARFTSKDKDGNDVVGSFTDTDSISKWITLPEDTFEDVIYDFSGVPKWSENYITSIGFDLPDGVASGSVKGYKATIDSIAVTGAESLEFFNLSAIEPKASAEFYGEDSVTTASNKYKVKDVEWFGDLVDGKYFNDDTPYKVKVTLVPESGYVVSDAPALATVNNQQATVSSNTELGRVYVEYEFDNTDKLDSFTMSVNTKDGVAAEINTPGEEGGTLQLEADVAGVDNKEVYWSISEEQSKYASVDENGLVTAKLNCEDLVVIASSKYDPEVKANITIKITGQIPERTVKFDAGIKETVTGLPADTVGKGFFRLPASDPARKNYVFRGWSKEIGGEIIETDYIESNEENKDEPVVYYANWGYAQTEEFKSASGVFTADSATVESSSVADGVLTLVPSNANTQAGIALNTFTGKPEASTAIFSGKLDSGLYDYIEVKTNIAPEDAEVTVGIQSMDNTSAVTPSGATDKVTFYSNKAAIASNPKYDIADRVLSTKDGEFYIYRFPASLLKNWNNTISHVSFNFAKRDVDVVNGGYQKFDVTSPVKFEYVRFVGRDVPSVDFINFSIPETKAVATTLDNVETAQPGHYEITKLDWNKALIEDMYYNGNTQYKVTITVKENAAYAPIPQKLYRVTINGEDVDTFRYRNKTLTITHTFDTTEDLGTLTLITVSYNENGNITSKKVFAGDVYDITAVEPASVPDGYKFLGWSHEENGEIITEPETLTADTTFYAVYEFIEGYDFSNEDDRAGNFHAENGELSFTEGWAVVTPESESAQSKLVFEQLGIDTTLYDYVEVIYDGNLEEIGADNKFGEDFEPVLIVNNGETEYTAVVSKVEPLICNYTLSYKYTYDLTKTSEVEYDEKGNKLVTVFDAERGERVKGITLAPYEGNPAWAIASVRFIKNADIEKQLVISDIKTPETWLAPDFMASVNDEYEVKEVKWGADEGFNANGSFKAETVYTVNVTVKPKTGYRIVREDALIVVDGEEKAADSAVINADGTISVKYTYGKTTGLVPFTLSIDGGAIEANGEENMTLQLVPVFTPVVEGEVVPVKSVKWEIVDNGPEGKSAEISEDGVLTAIYNAPDGIKIKATADYNPDITAETTVVITGLTEFYNVIFDKNTTAAVSGMPGNVQTKRDYQLPSVIPTREGFNFAGWTADTSNTATITKDYITKDTTYYAVWVAGINFEFASEAEEKLSFSNYLTEYDYENGVLNIKAGNNDPTMTYPAKIADPIFFGGDYKHVRVRMNVGKTINTGYTVRFTSVDKDGNPVVPFMGYDGDKYKVNAWKTYTAGSYIIADFDFSGIPQWTENYITQVRLDLPDGVDGEAVQGYEISIDYIRITNEEIVDFEIEGIDEPVAKKEADLDADIYDDRYSVTKIEWEPALLYDHFFDGSTEYTAKIYVKGEPGYIATDAPLKATVNGVEVTDFDYDYDTSELIVYRTFAATDPVDDVSAYTVSFIAKDADGNELAPVERKIFKGNSFDTTRQYPDACPDGMRFIGWSTKADAKASNVDTIKVTEDITLYAVYEKYTEFDFSNPFHTAGMTAKAGTVSVVGNLVVVSASSGTADSALITPAMNINGSDVAYVEVYYSADYESVHDKLTYHNRFGATREPELKFSTAAAPNTYLAGAKLIGAELVHLDGYSAFYKYTYDMSDANGWAGKIASLYADPYETISSTWQGGYYQQAFPDWGVRYIKLIPAKAINDDAEITLEAPATMAVPATVDDVSINENYEITSVVWSPDVSSAFDPFTGYTVSVTYKADSGYKLSSFDATINGEAATVVDNGDGTLTASYTFAETVSAKEVEVTISGKNTIKAAGRYLDLKATVAAVDGTEIPTTKVKWSVANKDGSTEAAYAKISENGRVYPKANGVVVVTAESVYNPDCKAEFEIDITGQAELYTVTFDKNTFEAVGNMPEAVTVNGDFVPEEYYPTREGYFLMGWSKDEDALEPESSFKITKDTTLYAKWGRGVQWTFDDASTAPNRYNASVEFKGDGKGYYTGSAQVFLSNDLSDVTTAEHNQIAMSFSTPTTTNVRFYVLSWDKIVLREDASIWGEMAAVGAEGFTADNGAFQVAQFSLEDVYSWNRYPYGKRVRLDMRAPQSGVVAVDWLRIFSNERYIKYDANGGLIPLYDGEVRSFKQTHDLGTISLPDDPVREGYVFLGWAKDPENYTKLYKNKFTLSDNTVLYAIWVAEEDYVPDTTVDEEPPKFIEVGNRVGFTEEIAPEPTYPTLSGNDGVTSHASSTTVTPTAKPKPTPPANTNQGGGTGSTPAEPEKPAETFPESKEYKAGLFADVKDADWFAKDVEKTYKLGLMNGKSDTEFAPNGTLTIAEAITVAARMNATYFKKTIPAAAAGEQWYIPYVKYATDNNLIKAGQFANYTDVATRAQVAQLFVSALPGSWYAPINFFTAVPDVASSDAAAKAVLMLYNAGIITGVDEAYNFKPENQIKRSELSAIINRVADKESRQRVVLDKAYEDKVITVTAEELTKTSIGGCTPKKLALKDGYATATGTGDPIVYIFNYVKGMKAEDIGKIEIGMKIDPANKGKYGATIYFTSNGASLSESLSLKTTYKNVSEDGYVTLTFDGSSKKEWTGVLEQLRFDPFNAKDEFGISYVRFLPKN